MIKVNLVFLHLFYMVNSLLFPKFILTTHVENNFIQETDYYFQSVILNIQNLQRHVQININAGIKKVGKQISKADES